LLQYRAYKEIAGTLQEWITEEERRYPRLVSMEPYFAALLPEVLIGVGVERFATLALRALTPKTPPVFSVAHLHAPLVSVKEEAVRVVAILRQARTTTFRHLITDAENTLVVVARFLALLELYREGVLLFEQLSALGELHIRWVGTDEGEVAVTDEFDEVYVPEDEGLKDE
jgi:segregation and condensation protein A